MTLDAGMCANGHVSYPTHPLCPECGEPQEETLDLADRTGEVVTWTHSTATPPGVREPNTLAIVEFDITDVSGASDEFVRALGQVTTDEVETGDTVEPVYVAELRDPDAGIKVPESQDWDGYRWDPV
ncbi:nucleic acid-binding protein [Haloarcula sp. CBA1130]|uniref:Zn-ribbon domain-containing OB-fold protein n=1 Tax=unclassified Haloarcula TaxID=2624677 RepID=UPI001248776E|nr:MULTISPECIES: nucleic acid-binding protein [unclassified Haloarcula]KAA9397406.1 nucleic acid-binding protein [Haloarcula sp. CBA1129]KAA9402561.1 nucleic acid-binding protein [Haloarcula sp. CBA1130]